MLLVGICDDDITLCGDLEHKLLELAKTNAIKIDTVVFSSGTDLLNYMAMGNKLDLVFLDIQMQDMNGIEVGQQIRNEFANDTVQIVYISSMQEYAMQLFKIRPMDFVIKPISIEALDRIFTTACKIIASTEEMFEFSIGQTVYRVPLKDILYFESAVKKVKLVSKEKDYLFYGKLKNIEPKLSELGFVNIHKSYLVNQLHITKYEYSQLTMSNSVILPISQSNRAAVRQIQLQRRKDSWK